jgi:hypothetical protein
MCIYTVYIYMYYKISDLTKLVTFDLALKGH